MSIRVWQYHDDWQQFLLFCYFLLEQPLMGPWFMVLCYLEN